MVKTCRAGNAVSIILLSAAFSVMYVNSVQAQENGANSTQNALQQIDEINKQTPQNQTITPQAPIQNSAAQQTPPIEGQLPSITPNSQVQMPAADGVIPLVTPFDSVLPLTNERSPLDFTGEKPPTSTIIPLIQPDPSAIDQATPSDNLEESPEVLTQLEETLPESEQELITNILNEDLLFSFSNESLLPTLSQAPVLGSGDAAISEMAGLISPSVPIGRYSRKGLSFHAIANQSFDTNPARLADTTEYDGDYATSGSILVAYQPVVRGLWSFIGNIQYGYVRFTEADFLNSAFQTTNARISYNGARLTSQGRLRYTAAKAANREVRNVSDQTNFNLDNNTRYKISGKTSLELGLSYSMNQLEGGTEDKRDNIVARLSGVWRYSPMLEYSGGFRVSEQTSDFGSSRSSYGPSVAANYRLSKLLRFRSEISVEFATLNDTFNDIGIDASLGFVYRPSTFWTFNIDYRRSNQPVLGNNSSFQVLNGVRLGITRQIASTSASLGVGYENASIESVSIATAVFDRKFLTIDASVSRPLFRDVLNGSIYVRYADQNETTFSWVSTQIGIGISYLF